MPNHTPISPASFIRLRAIHEIPKWKFWRRKERDGLIENYRWERGMDARFAEIRAEIEQGKNEPA